MKQVLILVIIIFLVIGCQSMRDKSMAEANKFMLKLAEGSVYFHDMPLNRYATLDIDNDNVLEVLEEINYLESKNVGFLNVELYDAFVHPKIYKFDGDSFKEDHSSYEWFRQKQIEKYLFWEKQIHNPFNLNENSRQLIKANKAQFLKEINRLKDLVQPHRK